MEPNRAFPARSGDSSYHGNTASGNSRVQYGHHYGDATNIFNYGDKDTKDLRTQITDSLWFDTMDARQDAIQDAMKGAAPDTLAWIYQPQEAIESNGDDSLATGPQWDSLATWLEEESSTYWVCGKAGTGKSTLMAHVVDDPQTKECLATWARDEQLHVLSFFFWRPVQKSIRGLLRTILYQLCFEVEDVAPIVANNTRRRPSHHTTWTEERLAANILATFSATDHKFCIFLDGLDEYEGDVYLLIDLISRLEALSHVKICVSSRPEAELTRHFSGCRQLHLERLNRSDIQRLVQTRLECHSDAAAFRNSPYWDLEGFIEEVVHRAEGIFLWTVLVLRRLSRGLDCGDSIEMLLARLESTPKEMTELYATLFSNIDREHQNSLGIYLLFMRFCKEAGLDLNVAQVTAAMMDDETTIASYDHFHQACEDEKLRVTSYSAGLLHIVEEKPVDEHSPPLFEIPGLRSGTYDQGIRLKDPITVVKSRAARPDHVFHLKFTRDEGSVVNWIHRSAYEFVFPIDGTISLFQGILHGLGDSQRIHRRLLLGCLKILAFGPSHGFERDASASVSRERMKIIIRLCESIFDIAPALVSEILGRTRLIVAEMDPAEFGRWSTIFHLYEPKSRPGVSTAPFWEEQLSSEAELSTIVDELPKLTAETATNALLLPLFWEIVSHDRHYDSEVCDFIAEAISQNLDKQVAMKAKTSTRLFFADRDNSSHDPWMGGSRYASCTIPSVPNTTLAVEYHFLAIICSRIVHRKTRRYASPMSYEDEFEAIARSVDLHWDFSLGEASPKISGPSPKSSRHRLLWQGNYQLMEALFSSNDRGRFGHANFQYRAGLRLVCMPAGRRPVSDHKGKYWRDFGEETDFFTFEPSVKVSSVLLQGLVSLERGFSMTDDPPFVITNWLLVDLWTRMLVTDVWENSQGLNATQQLLALACIKLGMRRWPQVKLLPRTYTNELDQIQSYSRMLREMSEKFRKNRKKQAV